MLLVAYDADDTPRDHAARCLGQVMEDRGNRGVQARRSLMSRAPDEMPCRVRANGLGRFGNRADSRRRLLFVKSGNEVG